MFKISPEIRHRLALELRPPIARRERFSFVLVGKPFSISAQVEHAFRMKAALEGGFCHEENLAQANQESPTNWLVAMPTAATSDSVITAPVAIGMSYLPQSVALQAANGGAA